MKLNDLKFDATIGNALTTRRADLEARSALKSLKGVYEEHAKMVFLFDVSGSMCSRVARTYEDQYAWTPELLADIRKRALDAAAKLRAEPEDEDPDGDPDPLATLMGGLMGAGPELSPEEANLLRLLDESPDPNQPPALMCDDEELKRRIIQKDLIAALGIMPDWAKKHEVPPTRIEIVRKLAKQELESRFKRFPRSQVAVIAFAGSAKAIFDDGAPGELWPVLEGLEIGHGGLNSGATRILTGLEKAISVCRAKPSPVGVHHAIVVSDGQDYEADCEIGGWVPTLRESGVVLDYIHIGDNTPNAGISAACKALGGDCVTVNSEKEIEEKFIQAVRRPMLPPPAA